MHNCHSRDLCAKISNLWQQLEPKLLTWICIHFTHCAPVTWLLVCLIARILCCDWHMIPPTLSKSRNSIPWRLRSADECCLELPSQLWFCAGGSIYLLPFISHLTKTLTVYNFVIIWWSDTNALSCCLMCCNTALCEVEDFLAFTCGHQKTILQTVVYLLIFIYSGAWKFVKPLD